MMGYPALLVASRISHHPVIGPLVAGAALASWDLFLDPQMVDVGHWVWAFGSGPRILDVPVSNFAGWLAVSTLMMALLWRTLPSHSGGTIDDRVPCALFLWTYGSSVLAHAVFFGLPGSALLGGSGWVPWSWRPPEHGTAGREKFVMLGELRRRRPERAQPAQPSPVTPLSAGS
jgi:hypothetical protein